MKLTADILLRAYAAGVFPMAESADDPALFWLDPEMRGILPLDGFHCPSRLARTVRQNRYEVRIDHDFTGTVAACAAATDNRPETWINSQIKALYGELFEMGHAHSVECYQDDAFVGGLYGVSLNGAFFGESMVSMARDASKVALVHLIARLKAGGYQLLDCQFLNDHLKQFGVIEIPKADYHARLDAALLVDADFYGLPKSLDGATALQSITQTS